MAMNVARIIYQQGGNQVARSGQQLAKKLWNIFGMSFSSKLPENCRFCRSPVSIGKQNVIYAGKFCYLALAKGPLVPDHMVLVPKSHVSASVYVDSRTKAEMTLVKHSIQRFFDDCKNSTVFVEKNFDTSHLHVHTLPISQSKEPSLKKKFTETAGNHGMKVKRLRDEQEITDVIGKDDPYFLIEISGIRLLMWGNFPDHFFREVLASKDLLDVPDRVIWRNSCLEGDEEMKMCQSLIERFEKYSV